MAQYILEDHDRALAEATSAREALVLSRLDRWYPRFHIVAPAGLVNHPNGLCFYNGRYHVFYQHQPYGVRKGLMHWGHASSEDLLRWDHEPIALAPSVGIDSDGVFSGSAVVTPDNEMALIYTGRRYRNGENDADGIEENQCLALSQDGIHFDKKGVVLPAPEGMHRLRDPKVWLQGDTYYMVLGVQNPKTQRGEVWLYSSTDLHSWDFDHVLYTHPDPDVHMIERPDFFELDGHWVLILSPLGLKPSGIFHRNSHNSGYVVGLWEPGENFLVEKEYDQFDFGHNFHAPQTFMHDGRRILIGWMGSFDAELPTQIKDGWCGQLSIPRGISLSEESLALIQKPIIADPAYRTMYFKISDENAILIPESNEYIFRIDRADFHADRLTILLHDTGPNATAIIFDDLTNTVSLDRGFNQVGERSIRTVPVDPKKKELVITIIVDSSSIEVFVNDGVYSISSLSFPPSGSRSSRFAIEGGKADIKVII